MGWDGIGIGRDEMGRDEEYVAGVSEESLEGRLVVGGWFGVWSLEFGESEEESFLPP